MKIQTDKSVGSVRRPLSTSYRSLIEFARQRKLKNLALAAIVSSSKKELFTFM